MGRSACEISAFEGTPLRPLRLAVTGFVSEQEGSVAGANALLLRGLLAHGCHLTFFSKSSFVDPRPAVGSHPHFTFCETENRATDRLRRRLQRIPFAGLATGLLDACCYRRLLVQKITQTHQSTPFDLCLWLGDFAAKGIPRTPTVSFVQGPPGTDARSVIDHFSEILELCGPITAFKWRALSHLRLSQWGLPALKPTDHFIVGSRQSSDTLEKRYDISSERISTLPYPIDLNLFQPILGETKPRGLRAFWLGRIIPRKRLDLFLEAAVQAIRQGLDLHLTLVGGVGFIPGYEKWIAAFPYPERLTWEPYVARTAVPALLKDQDVLVQPSDEENFGSSVAEAQACGLPVIVGSTNGNADYLCARDIHLQDDRPETLARAFHEMALRKQNQPFAAPTISRQCAIDNFDVEKITDRLLDILQATVERSKSNSQEP